MNATKGVVVNLDDWNDFLYIVKIKTGKQHGSEFIRRYIKSFNKRNQDILDNRKNNKPTNRR